jgi:hypothetical protein
MQETQIRKDMAPVFFNLGIGLSAWLDSHPNALPLGTDGRYPLNRKLDGPGLCLDAFEKKKVSSLCRESNHNSLLVFSSCKSLS